PHQTRVARGEKHPVYDFLFRYYAFRPAWLRQWHPGPDVVLTGSGAREFLRWPAYKNVGAARDGSTSPSAWDGRESAVTIDVTTFPAPRLTFVAWLRDLLT